MKKIISIFLDDIKRISKRPAAVVILVGLLIIPGIYAWLNIDSNWNPYGNTGKLPIAIVNKDNGTVILGEEINMGNLVVDGLKDNKDMKWIFTNEKDAKHMLEKSEYYGEIVIPENFSTKLITIFDTKKIERPQFDFYVNHKKNPIAPIIVNKAVGAIQNTINQNIINAIIYKVLNTAEDIGLVTKAARTTEELVEKLNKAKSNISDLRAIFKTMEITADLTNNSLNAFKELLPTVDNISGTTQNGIKDMQNALKSFKDLTNDIDETVSSIKDDSKDIANVIDSFDESPLEDNKEIMKDKMNELSEQLKEKSEKIDKIKSILNRVGQNLKLPQLDGIQDKLQKISDSIGDTQKIISNTKQTKNEIKEIKNKLKAIQTEEVEVYSAYRDSIKGDLNSAYTNANQSMDSINELLSGVSKATGKTDKALDSMIKALGNTKDLTDNMDNVFSKLQDEIDKIVDSLSGEKESEMYDKFVNLIENDPVEVANFLSTPVKTNEIDLYDINTYGSKMAPFYTILACWVGCTLLISIVKTDIDNTTIGTEKLRNYQKFLGRFLLFGSMAVTQGLIIGIGDILLKVQVINIPLFIITIMMSSFVFMLFVYSVTVSFGKVGEAFSIVVMVLQVAGSGGTFPIELLPRAFAVLQPIMPFYPAMNILREAIGGLYKNNYIYYMMMLLSHTIIPLLLGLLFRNPLIHLKEKLDRELEKTDIII
ncbi:hypothetical protein BCR36DRAFT_583160 [Piromyces finnis]|uniref:ABC-2 type transporter transmembrane domain-containing protein n=1 Tax=Piromyces finnis TaxID=1754191 RepID=A0A1Y1VAK3_9FUNG|nr:hypothetical protein BCR36DRAFT_583160 [Piromyces finnis]|eukprot:ORX51100.1 hypothetical protein BCR36DRAFT_583160 [Piromyces finnis]